MSGIFLIHDDKGDLVEMIEQPYDSEDLLQKLLAKYPNLIAGDQINASSPRRWLLVTREASIQGEEEGAARWSVDHLFLDQDGIPTLVEVKRSTDTRLRREVVAQMLDYAANAVSYWSIKEIRAKFENDCSSRGQDTEEALQSFLNGECEPEDFWSKVKTNLEAGKIRMLFVADVIPAELQRIIEFLNAQMDPAEVLGVEIRQFAGEGVRTLVPRVMGQSVAAQDKKTGSGPKRQWDEESFLAETDRRSGARAVKIAERLLAWSKHNGLDLGWGKGNVVGAFRPRLQHKGTNCRLFSMFTVGNGTFIEIAFGQLKNTPAFGDESRRLELARRLNRIPGANVAEDRIDRYPRVEIDALDGNGLSLFLEAFDWVIATIRES